MLGNKIDLPVSAKHPKMAVEPTVTTYADKR